MRLYYNAAALFLVVLLVGSIQAKKKYKPYGAYITGAKIEVISGDEERYEIALNFLDTVKLGYGPIAEAIYWQSKIYVDFMDKRSNLKEKLPFAEKFVAYQDSLHQCCENEEIKKKYRKKCDQLTKEIDSTASYFWKVYYNAAVGQIGELEELANSVANAQDSSEKAYFTTRLAAQTDSCTDNMQLAILMDSTDARTYLGLATVYEKNKDYERSKGYLLQSLDKTDERTTVLLQLAYNFIYTNDYCGAVPHFREYVETMSANEEVMADLDNVSTVASTMENLGICYNNCQMYDSAYALHLRLLELTPDNARVQASTGRYHNQMARYAADSINYYKDQDNEAEAKKWEDLRNMRFDSSLVFLKKAFELQPDDIAAAEEYGVIAAIRQNYAEAKIAFARVSELNPTDTENWTSLGDCNLRLQDFAAAAEAYEKVVELEPDNKDVIQSLVGIHNELGNKARMAELQKKLESL